MRVVSGSANKDSMGQAGGKLICGDAYFDMPRRRYLEHIEKMVTPASVGLLLLGLLFVAGGSGVFVAGHPEGMLVVFVGVAMLWAGWNGSQARGLSCLIAAALNTLDASITLASWNYEVNPFVVSAGPTLFLCAKLLLSFAIVAYARTAPNPRKGGYLLSGALSLIIAWNLGQLAIISYNSRSMLETLFWGSAASILLALVTLMVVTLKRKATLRFLSFLWAPKCP